MLSLQSDKAHKRHHQPRAVGQGQYGSRAGSVTQICSPFNSKHLKKVK